MKLKHDFITAREVEMRGYAEGVFKLKPRAEVEEFIHDLRKALGRLDYIALKERRRLKDQKYG